MLKILKITFSVFGGLLLLLASLQALSVENSMGKSIQPTIQAPPSPTPISIEDLPNIDDLPLRDNPNIYQYDDPGSVVTMYVTVRKGNASDNSAHSWKEINDSTKWAFGLPIYNVVLPKIEAIVQFGDESGPLPNELGYGEIVPNATVQIRGASTSSSPQKSYKIEILNNAGRWRGQSTLNLNKHIFDDTRMRNKLNFDLMKQIPNMVSLRTQFVHLYIKDETTDPWGTTFVDYGLFTQIEQPNKRFLRNHLLDPDGQLYKATFFEFYRYPDQIRLIDDPLYNENTFSTILETKGNNDNSKLTQMLDDVNNYDIPIEQTFEKYFNSDNYFTWLAYNILIGNVDTQSQNYYLYSPGNGNKWYFIPWDYDGSLPLRSWEIPGSFRHEDWEVGVSNYWGGVLHNRVLRVTEYRNLLDEKVKELKTFLFPERIQSLLNVYKPITDQYVLRMPDLLYLSSSVDDYNKAYEVIPGDVQENYELYLQSLESPMPFYLGTPKLERGVLKFNWEDAYDFNGEDITYRFIVARDFLFEKVVIDETLINVANIQFESLKPGTYFWRVAATNESGKLRYPFDYYLDEEHHQYQGMKYLVITEDGQVLEK